MDEERREETTGYDARKHAGEEGNQERGNGRGEVCGKVCGKVCGNDKAKAKDAGGSGQASRGDAPGHGGGFADDRTTGGAEDADGASATTDEGAASGARCGFARRQDEDVEAGGSWRAKAAAAGAMACAVGYEVWDAAKGEFPEVAYAGGKGGGGTDLGGLCEGEGAGPGAAASGL